MKKKEISFPIVGLVGFVTGFVCLTVAGRAFIRYEKKCFKRTLEAIAEDLKKGFSMYNEQEIETDELSSEATPTNGK